MIFETPADCGIKMKDGLNLLHRNGVSEPGLSFSTIYAIFERVEVWLHKLLITNLFYSKVATMRVNILF